MDVKVIIDIFAEERDILIRLLSISEQQKALIIKGDVKSLGSLLETEAVLSNELGKLEEKRVIHTGALAERLGRSARNLTLKQIAGMTEDPGVKGKLLALRSELSEMLRKQKRYNRTNQELLKRKKNYINVMLGVLLQEEPIGSTYDCNGSIGNRYQSTGLFNQSV